MCHVGEELEDSLKSIAKSIFSFLSMRNARDTVFYYSIPIVDNRAEWGNKAMSNNNSFAIALDFGQHSNMKYREPATVVPEHCADFTTSEMKYIAVALMTY